MRPKHPLKLSVLDAAIKLAEDGPRASAIVLVDASGTQLAIPGYMDKDKPRVKQLALVTPDGRVWLPVPAVYIEDDRYFEDDRCPAKSATEPASPSTAPKVTPTPPGNP